MDLGAPETDRRTCGGWPARVHERSEGWMDPTGSDIERITKWMMPTAFLPNLTWFPSTRGQGVQLFNGKRGVKSTHQPDFLRRKRQQRRARRELAAFRHTHRAHSPADQLPLSAASAASAPAAATGRAAAAGGRTGATPRVAAAGPPAPARRAPRGAAPPAPAVPAGRHHREDHDEQYPDQYESENRHLSHRPSRSPATPRDRFSCRMPDACRRGREMPLAARSQSRLEQLQRLRAGWPP